MKTVELGALAAALILAPGAALAAPPPGLDGYVEQAMRASGAPGMAVTIVEGGRTTYAKGFGVRRLGAPEKVDDKTIFPTGSTGKAFTVAALATLVDQGKLRWDDHVIDRLPDFQMYDPWVTREMTVRDLLVHRSGLGLGEGDLLFVPRSTYTRAQTVHQLRYLKPATSFRSGYAYDNVLYMAAGQLIEAVSGQTWEDYVREHVLKPAGMTVSTTDEAHRFATADRAWPHARLSGPIRGVGDQEVLNERDALGQNAAPAGGLSASASDLAQWLKIQLAHGALPGGSGRLYSDAQAEEMWTPQIHIPIQPAPAALQAATPQFQSYALGWDIRDWRGHKIISHGGAVFGFLATVVLIPEKNVGFSILVNAEEGVPVRGLMYRLLDHYLGFPDTDWPKVLAAVKRQQVEAALKTLPTGARPEGAGVGPLAPLDHYAGLYQDAWYGPVDIRIENGKLVIDFKHSPGMVGDLEHWRYDTFRTHWRDRAMEPAFVTFSLGSDGKVTRIAMKPVSPLADFSWDYQDLDLRPAAKEN